MNLYIIRHSLAVDAGTPGYENDSQRPLTEKGQKRFRKIAHSLRAQNIKLDMILSSPYLRARQTAEILADEFNLQSGQLAFSDNLLLTGFVDQLIAEINEKYPVESLALVGHEPALSALIGTLVAGNANLSVTLKKGSVCYLSADNLRHERSASLEWLLTPAQLLLIE